MKKKNNLIWIIVGIIAFIFIISPNNNVLFSFGNSTQSMYQHNMFRNFIFSLTSSGCYVWDSYLKGQEPYLLYYGEKQSFIYKIQTSCGLQSISYQYLETIPSGHWVTIKEITYDSTIGVKEDFIFDFSKLWEDNTEPSPPGGLIVRPEIWEAQSTRLLSRYKDNSAYSLLPVCPGGSSNTIGCTVSSLAMHPWSSRPIVNLNNVILTSIVDKTNPQVGDNVCITYNIDISNVFSIQGTPTGPGVPTSLTFKQLIFYKDSEIQIKAPSGSTTSQQFCATYNPDSIIKLYFNSNEKVILNSTEQRAGGYFYEKKMSEVVLGTTIPETSYLTLTPSSYNNLVPGTGTTFTTGMIDISQVAPGNVNTLTFIFDGSNPSYPELGTQTQSKTFEFTK